MEYLNNTAKNAPKDFVKQLDGVIVINKPKGISSAKCIAKLKSLGQKKNGHAGTLDPLATGVLIVLLGQATKLSNYFLEAGKKTYQGVLCLGKVSDTLDIEGNILEESEYKHITTEQIENEINYWTTLTSQEVPQISAAKHNGTSLYKLARQGKEVPVKYKDIEVTHAVLQLVQLPYVHFEASVSSGTYIRSLAHSLGKRLGSGAILTELTRIYSYPFSIEQSYNLEEITASNLKEMVIPLHKALPNFEILVLSEDKAQDIKFGKSIEVAENLNPQKRYFLLDAKENPLALAEVKNNKLTILRGLFNS